MDNKADVLMLETKGDRMIQLVNDKKIGDTRCGK